MQRIATTTPELTNIYGLVNKLSDEDKLSPLKYLTASLKQRGDDEETASETPFSDEEVAEMMRPKPKKTGREIVEAARQAGAIGSWADRGIDDPVEFLEEQRQKRFAQINKAFSDEIKRRGLSEDDVMAELEKTKEQVFQEQYGDNR